MDQQPRENKNKGGRPKKKNGKGKNKKTLFRARSRKASKATHASAAVKSEPIVEIRAKKASRTAPAQFHPQSARREAQPIPLDDSYDVPPGSCTKVHAPNLLITGNYRSGSFWTPLDGYISNPVTETMIRIRKSEYVKSADFVPARVHRKLMRMCRGHPLNLYLCLIVMAKFTIERISAIDEMRKREEVRSAGCYKYRSLLVNQAEDMDVEADALDAKAMEVARIGAECATDTFCSFLVAIQPIVRMMRMPRNAWTGWNPYDEGDCRTLCASN